MYRLNSYLFLNNDFESVNVLVCPLCCEENKKSKSFTKFCYLGRHLRSDHNCTEPHIRRIRKLSKIFSGFVKSGYVKTWITSESAKMESMKRY